MRLTIQVIASLVLVVAVLWAMWRWPRKDESLFAWAPPLALFSAWVGLGALAFTVVIWFVYFPDRWLPVAFLLLDPATIGAGILVLWIYRDLQTKSDTITAQRTQAWVGIILGLAAVTVGYVYVMIHKV